MREPIDVREPIDSLSLGAGVQSSTLALMANEGEIDPAPAFGIFADTKREPGSVYRWLSFLCGVEVKHRDDGRPYVEPGRYMSGVLKFPVYIVTAGDIGSDALRVRQRRDGKGSWVPSGIPHYSINADGSHGHGPRQCTLHFKLITILREQRRHIVSILPLWRKRHRPALKEISAYRKALAIYKRAKKLGQTCPIPSFPASAFQECQEDALMVAWIGISTDEAGRAKPSLEPWIRNRWPHLERGTNRDGCEEWFARRGLKAPKSACEMCPYHDDDEWIRLREHEPFHFSQAVGFDYAYRDAKSRTVSQKGFQTFLHDSRLPLDKVEFQKSHGKQLTMFNNECEGICGV